MPSIGEHFKKFMLHYNFPPFSVGEVKFLRGPSRREIGHGNLAERALVPVLPAGREFSLHSSNCLGNFGVQRIDFHGDGVRRIAVADGCRRAGYGARGGYRHGLD